jgi:hypothetical protein
MSTRPLANFEHTSAKADLHHGSRLQAIPGSLSLEPPRYVYDGSPEEADGLGCLRGIATALVPRNRRHDDASQQNTLTIL